MGLTIIEWSVLVTRKELSTVPRRNLVFFQGKIPVVNLPQNKRHTQNRNAIAQGENKTRPPRLLQSILSVVF